MIEVENIKKSYGKLIAVNNVSFKVDDGEIMGLLGSNGAGKTTTLNIISGYSEPEKGRVLINGIDIEKNGKKAKKDIGYMPENIPLYQDLTVREYLDFICDLKKVKKQDKEKEIDELITKAQLESVRDRLIKNISRGYKQRVSFAGAMVGNPNVIILDEPTVGLDPKQTKEIRELIKDLKKDHCVIFSSHILSEVQNICDKVVIIDNGEIIAQGTPEELENKNSKIISINVLIEKDNKKIEDIKNEIDSIVSISKILENDDGSVEYEITSREDIRKLLFEKLYKLDVNIIELKKKEKSFEDTFIKIVSKNEKKKSMSAKEKGDKK